MKKENKPSAFSRLMEYAGSYKILTYMSWILSFLSALTALLPLVYIFFIIREVLEVAPDFSRATSIVHNGIMAVVQSMMDLTVLISANLGVLNLFPIPGLDGSRLLFLLIEKIRRTFEEKGFKLTE